MAITINLKGYSFNVSKIVAVSGITNSYPDRETYRFEIFFDSPSFGSFVYTEKDLAKTKEKREELISLMRSS